MLKDYFEVEDIVMILDVDEVSACEILDGTLELEADELLELSDSVGVCVDKLLTKDSAAPKNGKGQA